MEYSKDNFRSWSADDFRAVIEEHGSERSAAKALGIPRTTFQDAKYKAVEYEQYKTQQLAEPIKIDSSKNENRYYIFSAAQDNTQVEQDFLKNLKAYADYLDAEIIISGFTYNKGLFEDHSKKGSDYHPAVREYLCNDKIEICNKLLFCGEMNILPTAVAPLSGLETYTKDKWGIFPHSKIQLLSVPTMKNDDSKIIMTTGCVTKKNYVPKKAGLKAEHHHVLGAVILEIDREGDIFCRHLIADEDDGFSFQDLDKLVKNGRVSKGKHVEAINWGDIHREKIDKNVAYTCWNLEVTEDDELNVNPKGTSIIDDLKPKFQFFHDVGDFETRNHHNVGDPHFRFKMHSSNRDSVEESLRKVSDFLEKTTRKTCDSVVVESNHDLALLKWLKTSDYRYDPINALFFLKCQTKIYESIANNTRDFSIFEYVMRDLSESCLAEITFLREDESFTICGNDIECGIHGHLGANGSRGNPRQFIKMGPKVNTGHTHSAQIIDGIYTAGVSGKLDMGYNKGLSSWSHSHIITYPNGKRTIITMQNKGLKWRAE